MHWIDLYQYVTLKLLPMVEPGNTSASGINHHSVSDIDPTLYLVHRSCYIYTLLRLLPCGVKSRHVYVIELQLHLGKRISERNKLMLEVV